MISWVNYLMGFVVEKLSELVKVIFLNHLENGDEFYNRQCSTFNDDHILDTKHLMINL